METDDQGLATEEDYALLGLDPSLSQNPAVVKAVYRVLARDAHPDVIGGNDQSFVLLQGAYERVLAAAERPPDEWIPPSSVDMSGTQWFETKDPPDIHEEYGNSSPPSIRRGTLASVGRFVFFSGSWPASEFGIFIGLVLSIAVGFAIRRALHPGVIQAIVEVVPVALFAGRAISVHSRLDRRGSTDSALKSRACK